MRRQILCSVVPVLLGILTPPSQAQTLRTCDSYIVGAVAVEILGQPVANNPGSGQYSKDQSLEWQACDWVGYYPPVAPGAPPNPATLSVSIQRYASVDAMRKSQLSPQELGSKVKIERLAKFGELGAFYTNIERNTIGAAGSKGSKAVSISVDMGLNPVRPNARRHLEATLAKLWTEL